MSVGSKNGSFYSQKQDLINFKFGKKLLESEKYRVLLPLIGRSKTAGPDIRIY